ncbi:MAG: DUF1289 domain-containing protein [Rhodobacteraceae bacterium]|nr:MAG: DUF1289 domain-containing protein [Paracoccaceae bacterium]
MTDHVWRRKEVDSPCVKLCVIDPEYNLCIGCFRTIAEISKWSALTPENRRKIISSLKERGKFFRPKRRGGKSRHGRD